MLPPRKTLFLFMSFFTMMTLYIGHDVINRLSEWNPSIEVVSIMLLGIVFILPFIVYHWLYFDFIIWDWKRDAPPFYYHINHDFSWLKYLGFGPVLAAAIAPFLRATPKNVHDAFMLILGVWLNIVIGYVNIVFIRGLLNVHKR